MAEEVINQKKAKLQKTANVTKSDDAALDVSGKKSKPVVTITEKEKAKPRKKRTISPLQAAKIESLRGYNRYEKVRNRYYSLLKRAVQNSKPTTNLYNTLSNKKTQVSGFTRKEIKRFDKDFIEEIERIIPSLETIVISPHKFINEFTEIVQVEKARKITPRAVKFMAQNTQMISEIQDGGIVIPKQVLNVFVDDDVRIYENRFIMTLVKRLQVFIELRYKYILEHGDTKNSDQINIKNEIKLDDLTFEFEGKIKMSIPSDDEGARQSNIDLLERLKQIRKRTLFLVTSSFMKEMAKAVPVADPIQQTNIIRLNYAYQDAYQLWLFINRYDELGITYTTTQSKIDFDDKYMEKINQLVLNSFLAIETEHGRLSDKVIKQKTIKPYITPGELDYDLSDERFLEGGLPVKIRSRQETAEQKEARLKREAAKEKARQKREAKLLKDKERAALKKAKEKAAAKEKKAREAEKAKERQLEAKRRQAEKNLERARIRAEKEKILAVKRAYKQKIDDEWRKLKLARIAVAKLADKEKKNAEK